MRLTIVGAGAIGGLAGAYLARAGHEVLLVDADAEHRQAIARGGLTIEREHDEFTVAIEAIAPEELQAPVTTALLAVKSQHTDTALARLAPLLTAEGVIVSLQNGVNPPRIAACVGAARTVGAFVNYSGDVLAPGRIRHGGTGRLYIGDVDGPCRPRTYELGAALNAVSPTTVTDNIYGYLWAKQCEMCLFWVSALCNETTAAVAASPEARPAIRAVVSEAVAVTRRLGVRLEAIGAFDPGALAAASDEEAADMLAAVGAMLSGGQKPHTGMWRDLAIRHRPSEVEGTLGLLVREGREHGAATPAIAAMVEMVRGVEVGRRPLAWDNVIQLSELAKGLLGSGGG